MNEKGTGVLEKYDFNVTNTYRGRRSVICETDKGLKLLKEYDGGIEFEETFLKNLIDAGFVNVDLPVRNIEGNLVTEDEDGTKYVVKNWFKGRECNIYDVQEAIRGAQSLASLHNVFKEQPYEILDTLKGLSFSESMIKQYERHNVEMKKVRSFIRKKHSKNAFELEILKVFDKFYSEGVSALNKLKMSGYSDLKEQCKENREICHGSFNQHNVIIMEEGVAVTNFGKASINLQIIDFYGYLRKVMEKNNWDIYMGRKITEAYCKIRPVSKEEKEALKIFLSYPEKFWKIINYYYNSNKSWISEANFRKLETLCLQNEHKENFIFSIFE